MTSVPKQAVVIGTSAGGIGALSVILPALPKDYPFANSCGRSFCRLINQVYSLESIQH